MYDMFFGPITDRDVKAVLKNLGIVVAALVMIVIAFNLETWEWILVGVLVVFALILDVLFSKIYKKLREKDENL